MNMHLRIAAVALVLALVAVGCSSPGPSGNDPRASSAATTGVTTDSITIGSHQPLTGLAAPGASQVAPAAQAYFNYVNEHGGVHGRKIFFNYQDDAYVPANSISVVRKLVEQDKVFAILDGYGTGPHEAVADYLNEQKVPDLFPITGCPCFNDPAKLPYTFAWQTDYIREGKILGDHIEKAFPGKRIAYFYQNDDFGKNGVAGLDQAIPASQVVARESYRPRYDDVTPQLQDIAQAKADVIVAFSVPADTALLRLAQQKLGNTAQLVVSYVGSDPTTLSALLSGPAAGGTPQQGSPLMQGIITDTFLTPADDTSDSWMKLGETVRSRYLPAQPLNRYTETGIATAYLFVQALQRAGRDLTRQSLVAALEQGGLSPGPGLTPLDYSHTSHAGFTGTQIGVIQGSTVALQGQPLITDNGNGPVIPYAAPKTSPPPDGIPTP